MVAWVRNTLCDRGAIDRAVRGTWVITETDGGWLRRQHKSNTLTCFIPYQCHHPLSLTPSESRSRSSRWEILCITELRTTAQSGVDATAFEEALAEAFRVLGFHRGQNWWARRYGHPRDCPPRQTSIHRYCRCKE